MKKVQVAVNNGIISGDVFIIPNESVKIGKNHNFFTDEARDYFVSTTIKKIHEDVDVPHSERYIQVWACTPTETNSNWADHYEMPGEKMFPHFLPDKLFEGKVEGDIIEFPSKWGTIKLKLNQLSYRYKRFGRFEEVMQKI